MSLIESIVKNPVKVAVGVLLIAMFGVIAVFSMPMQLTPEVQTPTITIETKWPGGSAKEVEREIVQEQEEQLKSVEGVTKMSSESKDSVGTITMEFPVGTDMGEALLKVNTRLQQVEKYPEAAKEPVIKTANLTDRPIAWFILSPRPVSQEEIDDFKARHPKLAPVLAKVEKTFSDGVAMYRLEELAEKHPELRELLPKEIDIPKLRKFAIDVIEARFERVDGVSDSTVMGGREEEMQVVLDPERLAARHLTIYDVRDALKAFNKDTSGGDFWQGNRRYIVRTISQYKSAEEIKNTIITYQGDTPIYIKDVGEVQLGYKKSDGFVRRFGMKRMAINAVRESGANVLDVMQGLQEANKELNEGILKQKGMELQQVYDETEYIYSAVGLVNQNIVVGGLLTFLVLLLFLRSFRSTVVIALAIPTSIVGTFLILFILGRSLNVISLAGLAFAVGMLVDNAVVVLENIYRYYQLGYHPYRAAVRGTKEVLGAVTASTLTTLAVFVPIIFVQEEAGQLFRDIALAISCGIALSMLVSMTLIPTAAARVLKSREESKDTQQQEAKPATGFALVFRELLLKPFSNLGTGFVNLIVGINTMLQKTMIGRVFVVLGFAAASILISWLLIPKVEYLPGGNRNLVFGILLPPSGYNLDTMTAMGEQIETKMRPHWDIDEDNLVEASKDYPAIGDYFYVVRGRQIFMGVRAKNPQEAPGLIPLVRKVGSGIPGTFAIARQSSLFEQGVGAGRSIDVDITGTDLKYLTQTLGRDVLGTVMSWNQDVPEDMKYQAIPKPSLDLSNPEVQIFPKLEQAVAMKVKPDELGYIADSLVDGAYATDFFKGNDKIDLRILCKDPFPNRKKDPEGMFYRYAQDLDDLPVATESGELVPMRALAHVKLGSGPEQINHRERQRAITIQVSPPDKVPLEEAMERLREEIINPMIESGKLKDGEYQINLSGTADKLNATWQALRLNFLLALLITYLLMAALFESWIYPMVIIVSVPLGAVGGILALSLLNMFTLQPLDVLTMLGFVILIGTVVNNPILIVEQTLVHIREEKMPMQQAILESVRNRIRPIFMTTTTTLFGLVPLVLFPGAGSELYRGLGAVVLGGLLVSTLVTLIVVPSFFSLTMEIWESISGKTELAAATEKDVALAAADSGKAVRETGEIGEPRA